MSDGNIFETMGGGNLPPGYTWMNEPETWEADKRGLHITPPCPSDLFVPPDGSPPATNPCLLSREVSGDFTATAKVTVKPVGFGDAAAITAFVTPELWAKLCLERSPHGDISIVSVVTSGTSDDSNGELVQSGSCWLRLSRIGSIYGMQHSTDGRIWRFARTFRLESPGAIRVGLQAQSPFDPGGKVVFEHFAIIAGGISDLRSPE